MVAPCIIRLESAIQSASDDVSKARLQAEMGCYLARIGEADAAQQIRDSLRATYSDGRDLHVSVLLMLLEGLQGYFGVLGGGANDRFTRAQFLSLAAQNKPLMALTSAWLAHLNFNDGEILKAIRNVKIAIDSVGADQWDALSRIGLVIGDLHMVYSDAMTARLWYGLGHKAALAYGDQATIGAWTYNSSAIRTFRLRIKVALGVPIDDSEVDFADAEARSATNFQALANVRALDHLLGATKASICILRSDFSQAANILDGLVLNSDVPESYAFKATLMADAVLAHASLGNSSSAQRILTAIESPQLQNLDVDDKILVFDSLNRAFEIAPKIFPSSYQAQCTRQLKEDYLALVDKFAAELNSLRTIPESIKV